MGFGVDARVGARERLVGFRWRLRPGRCDQANGLLAMTRIPSLCSGEGRRLGNFCPGPSADPLLLGGVVHVLFPAPVSPVKGSFTGTALSGLDQPPPASSMLPGRPGTRDFGDPTVLAEALSSAASRSTGPAGPQLLLPRVSPAYDSPGVTPGTSR